jgi:hypothetical protein
MLQSLQGTEAMVIRLCSDGMAEALGRRWRVRAGSRQVPVRGLLVELELTDEPIKRGLGMGDHR